MGKATRRVLRIIGEINYEALQTFCEELDELERESDNAITVELCSEGGDTYAGIAFYTKIRESHCDITIKAFGCVMSAATAIFAAGDNRMIHKDCWFMVHDDAQHVDAPNGLIAKSEAEHLDRLEYHWAGILAERSGTPSGSWRELSRKTTYIDAATCVTLGVADAIYG